MDRDDLQHLSLSGWQRNYFWLLSHSISDEQVDQEAIHTPEWPAAC
jgi:hypothetical protein